MQKLEQYQNHRSSTPLIDRNAPAVVGTRYYINIAENPMGYVPLFMAVTGQPCAVVGGDTKTEERVHSLLEAGANVTVISSSLTPNLKEMAERGAIKHRAREMASGDLSGFVLAYCTDPDPAIGRRAATEARALGIPINVTDNPKLCSFIAPAVVKRGALQIAVSTSGASPVIARILRQELEALIGPQYETLLEVLAAARALLRRCELDVERRAQVLQALAYALREPLMRDDYAAADAELRRHLALGLSDLGIDLRTAQCAGENLPSTPGSR
jgi:precorrin-2 dehydrogenase/sirohydrochlorin ferrochelatase